MKMLASLVAFAALVAVLAPSPAVAGGSLHHGRRVVILEQRPVVITRPNVLVVRPRPLFLSRPIIVQRPFLAGQPIIVEPPVVVPRSQVFFTVPRSVIVVR
jgi:hypothetical protein